jgi:hypothetical protein
LWYIHVIEYDAKWIKMRHVDQELEKRLDQKKKKINLEGNTYAQEINVSQLPV